MILLDRNMSDLEIIGAIQHALSDKNKLKMYSENLKKYISEKYMYKNGLELFENYIKNSNFHLKLNQFSEKSIIFIYLSNLKQLILKDQTEVILICLIILK